MRVLALGACSSLTDPCLPACTTRPAACRRSAASSTPRPQVLDFIQHYAAKILYHHKHAHAELLLDTAWQQQVRTRVCGGGEAGVRCPRGRGRGQERKSGIRMWGVGDGRRTLCW